MNSLAQTIADNLAGIHARIAASALAAGRDPAAVTLIAVSKTHPREAVLAARAAGQVLFGENRVQEAAQKFPVPGARLHIIGGLQTNKALEAVRLADSIDFLDRARLSDAIAAAAEKEGRLPELLVQVNIGDEPQKAGVATAEAEAFIRAARQRFGAALSGLMCIPPADQDPLPFFHHLVASGGHAWAAGALDGHVRRFRGGDCRRGDACAGRDGDFRVTGRRRVQAICGWRFVAREEKCRFS